MNKIVLIAIGVLVIIGGVIFLLPAPTYSPGSEEEMASSTTSGLAGATSSPTSTPTVIKPKSPTPSGATIPKKPTITANKIITPASGDQWVIRENHTIQWSEESLGNGVITLLDAQTKSVVGYITPSLTLHQKSFTWNTRDVFLSRTGSQKKDVQPGQYVLRVTFDVGNKAAIESGPVTLIYADQKPTTSQTVMIKNYAFSPSAITVRRGQTLYITNGDSISHKLLMSSFSPLTASPGETISVSTNIFMVGTYEFYSDEYPGMKLVITVQ